MSFYTVLILLCWMALAVLCILVHENSWIGKKDKRMFYLTYGIVALSALAEWLGVWFSGNEAIPVWLLSLIKCFDYILTPLAGGAIVAQMKLRNRLFEVLMLALTCNAVFQIIACFNGWMVVIDEHHHYSHGPLYGVYIAFYLFVIVLTAASFLVFSLSYRKQNRVSLISVFLLIIVGAGMQEIMGGECRTAYVALTIGVALMFIHYAEFYKMAADEQLTSQRDQLMKDALSGVSSRYAYADDMERYRKMTALPDTFTVFALDLNGLKTVNDTEGHDAGDELIIGAARCIEKAVGGAGKCYRTGGDEFVVITQTEREQAEEVLRRLEEVTGQWSSEKVAFTMSIAAGYARAEDHHGLTVEELAKKADQAMYAAKAVYYQTHTADNRREMPGDNDGVG